MKKVALILLFFTLKSLLRKRGTQAEMWDIQLINSRNYPVIAAHLAYIMRVQDSIYSPNLSVTRSSPIETINQITTMPTAEKLKVFLGLHVGGGAAQFDLGPEVSLLIKSHHLYGISNNLALK